MWVRPTLGIHKTACCWRESDLLITWRRSSTSSSFIASTVLSQPASGKINVFMWSTQLLLRWQGPQNYPRSKQEAQPHWWHRAILARYLKRIAVTVNLSCSVPKDCVPWVDMMLSSELQFPLAYKALRRYASWTSSRDTASHKKSKLRSYRTSS